jgi:AraC-like DNA-binding protein
VKIDAEWHLDQQFFAERQKAKVRILLSGELRTPDEHIHLKGAGAYLEVYPGEQFTSFIIAGGHRTRLLIVNLWPEFFSEVAGLSAEILPDPLGNLFTHADDRPQTALTPLGPDLLRAANDIMRSDVYQPTNLWKAFLSAKCQEIACSVVRELSGAGGNHLPQGLTVRDVNRIHEARDILADNFQRPPKITALAKKVGLNQTKLKSAFKAVFGTTISEFTMKCRMERAGELLTSTDVSIAEVAFAVGYDHPPNLSNAFRRYFGHTPSELRQARAVRKKGLIADASSET